MTQAKALKIVLEVKPPFPPKVRKTLNRALAVIMPTRGASFYENIARTNLALYARLVEEAVQNLGDIAAASQRRRNALMEGIK